MGLGRHACRHGYILEERLKQLLQQATLLSAALTWLSLPPEEVKDTVWVTCMAGLWR